MAANTPRTRGYGRPWTTPFSHRYGGTMSRRPIKPFRIDPNHQLKDDKLRGRYQRYWRPGF